MSRTSLRIGIETRQMAGQTTGVGNYSLHLLRALTASYPELQYLGFGRASWFSVNNPLLEYMGRSQQNGDAAPSSRAEWARKGLAALRETASRSELLRHAYRLGHRVAFASTVHFQRINLFHAFNYLPPTNPGVPVLPVVYDLSFLRYPETHPRERLRWLSPLPDMLRQCPAVQTISEFSRREIIDIYNLAPDRVFVAPPAAASLFRPLGREVSNLDLRKLGLNFGAYLLAVGTLEPRKNLRTLIAAYASLTREERQQAPLVVAGGIGWGNIRLPDEASKLAQEGSLRFMGRVSNPVLRSLYEGALALLFPSVYEGFGMPVVEAMSCGTPVIHSQNTSMDEITGGLCPRVEALSVQAWAHALKAQIASGYERSGSNALMERAASFDWGVSASQVCRAYDLWFT